MSVAEIAKALAGIGNLNPKFDFIPYDITKVQVVYGVPSMPVIGLDYVFAKRNRPDKTLVMGLTGQGRYLSNRNNSGTIEIGLLDGSPSQAGFELAALSGIPFPMAVYDRDCLLSGVVAISCVLIETPEWRRELFPGVVPYTFAADNLKISHGFRKIDTD